MNDKNDIKNILFIISLIPYLYGITKALDASNSCGEYSGVCSNNFLDNFLLICTIFSPIFVICIIFDILFLLDVVKSVLKQKSKKKFN